MKKRGKAISFVLTVALVLTTAGMPVTALAAMSDSLNPNRVTVTNNAGVTKDVIYITSGTRAGDVIKLYDTETKEKLLFESGAAKGSSFRFEIFAGILIDTTDKTTDEAIFLTVTGMGKTESQPVRIPYKDAPKSLPPIASNILVTNNAPGQGSTVYDRVNVTGLRSGDIFYVYYDDPAGGAAPITFSSTATTKGLAEAALKKDLPDTGPIWITVKSTGRTESDPVSVPVGGVDTTRTPIFATATNNYGSGDKIMITGLYPGDEVQAMEASTGVVYGSGKVGQRKTDVEITAKANRTGLSPSGGAIIINVTTSGKTTITAGPFSYDGEPKTSPIAVAAQSEFIGNMTSCGSVTIYNYENKLDQIVIEGLLPGDKILITTNLTEPQNEIEIKTGTVNAKSSVFKSALKLPEISDPATTGSIKIYVTSIGMEKSAPVIVQYSLSLQSQKPENLTLTPGAPSAGVAIHAITNSAVKNGDSIWVSGVERGDQIMIYENETAPTNGKETKLNAQSSGNITGAKSEVAVFAQFPEKGAGKVYVSYMKPGLQESERVEIAYGPEKQTSLSGINFVALNLAGNKDTLTITGAPKDAMIQAYTTSGANYLDTFINGSYVKIKNDKPAVASFTLPDIATNAPTGSGVIYIGVTLPGETESDLIPVYYDPEPLQEWDKNKITAKAVNVFGPLDYVVFSQFIDPFNLPASADILGVALDAPTPTNMYPGHTLATAKTVITLYPSTDPAIKMKMGSLTISNQYPLTITSGGYVIERIVNSKAFDEKAGTIAYTLTYPGKAESERIPISYVGEDQTHISLLDVAGGVVKVSNNINTGTMPDYVDVSIGGIVTIGSIIKVYDGTDQKASVLGKTIVTAKMSSDAAVRIILTGKNLLGPSAGSIWVTVQESGKAESGVVEVPYDPEGSNQTPDISALKVSDAGIYAIAIDNKTPLMKDFIFVCGLEPEDSVTLTYQASDTAKAVVRSQKVSAGQSTATFSIYIPEKAWEANSGYITVTRKGMSESKKMYLYDLMAVGAAPN